MRKVITRDLVPGMVLATDVYNFSDQLILPAGTVLTDRAITKLSFYSVLFVRIKDDESPAAPKAPSQPPVQEETSYSERVKSSEEFQKFQESFDNTMLNFSLSINDVVQKNADINLDAMVDDTLNLIQPGTNSPINVFDMVHNMRQYDDQTFAHSINVALISHVFAEWLGMSEEDCKLALTCGLLHDIGKLKIPEEIIKKPSRLTDKEFERVKTHPIEGYQLLQERPLSKHIKNAALMHHERFDGSGYPFGISGNKIDPFARMIAIADVYEATTASRVYRGPLCPFQVIAIFESEGLQKYDTHMIMTFLEKIVDTYMLNRVRLNNGMEGDIIYINKQALSRPTIKCGEEYIDLIKEPSLFIEAII